LLSHKGRLNDAQRAIAGFRDKLTLRFGTDILFMGKQWL
jgi:hypothetical protein